MSARTDAERTRAALMVFYGLAVVLIGALACACCAPGQVIDTPRQALLMLKNWLPLGFAVLALAAAARHWNADLVEPRRRLPSSPMPRVWRPRTSVAP